MTTMLTLARTIFVFSCVVPLLAFGQESKNQPIALINVSRDPVTVISKGKQVVPVQPGVPLFSGDRIQTGKGGQVQIYISGSGLLDVGSGSDLILTQGMFAETGEEHRIVKLIQGAFRAVFDKLLMPVGIETPTAVAGIRGTRIVAEQKAFSVLEGVVQGYGRRKGKPLEVYSGERFKTGRRGARSEPIPFEELIALDKKYDLGIEAIQTPYYLTHQQWVATVARQTGYRLPKGWAAYDPQLYLDLFSGNADVSVLADNFNGITDQGKMSVEVDKQGNPVLVARDAPFTVNYDIPVSADGDLVFESNIVGGPQYWTVEGKPTLMSTPSFSMKPTTIGPIKLKKGIYQVDISVPVGGKLSVFVPKGPKYDGIPLVNGWRKDILLTNYDMAITLCSFLKIPVTRDTLEGKKNIPFEQMAALLKEKGFRLGEKDHPVLGTDGVYNAALLRPKAPLRPKKKPSKGRNKSKPDEFRSSVSPVVPAL